jgi:DNA-binding response OmpR family regulator
VIVDDDVAIAEFLGFVLTLEGFTVRVAADGAGGLALVRRRVPDLVVLDLGLPDTDGCAVARSIREEVPSPPVLVALTGFGDATHRARTAEAGFAAHLVKPIEPDDLCRILRDLIGARG